MTPPLAYQAKAMSIRIVLFSLSTLLVATLFPFHYLKFSTTKSFNNDTESLLTNDEFQHTQVIPIPGAVGPESFEFDTDGGGPYTGVSDGRIIKWIANESRWIDFAVTSPNRDGCEGKHDHSKTEHICGRPLGLRFNERTGDLYIADAYMGLLVIGPNGGTVTQIIGPELNSGFTNSLDIDQTTGVVYFTDSSRRFPRRNHVSVVLSGDDSGRLMKYDPRNNETTLLLDNLKFPNGVALSKNSDFLIFAETTTCRLLKYWLKSPKAGDLEEITVFPGFPDNIKRNKKGEFWVGIASKRSKSDEWFLAKPWIGNFLVKVIPWDITKSQSKLAEKIGIISGMGIKLDEDGNVEKILVKRWKFVSEVREENGDLWIGSVKMPFAVKETFSGLNGQRWRRLRRRGGFEL